MPRPAIRGIAAELLRARNTGMRTVNAMRGPHYAIGSRIRARRIEMRMYQRDVARVVCRRPLANIISRWENGQALPRIPEFMKLCKVLNVSADYLLGLEK